MIILIIWRCEKREYGGRGGVQEDGSSQCEGEVCCMRILLEKRGIAKGVGVGLFVDHDVEHATCSNFCWKC